jgi:hypothetical protein
MHRTLRASTPLTFDVSRGDLEKLHHTSIRFIIVPRHQLQCHGTWGSEIHPHLLSYLQLSSVPEDHLLVPVHEFQLPWIQTHFPEFKVVKQRKVLATAQASTRTLVPNDPTFIWGSHIKLSICMTTTSAMRTISPFSIQNGPVLSEIATIVNEDRSILHILKEFATIGTLSLSDVFAPAQKFQVTQEMD